jgi:hypothetical protein
MSPSFTTALVCIVSEHSFSKELLALIETLIAFSPYYVANGPNAAGPIDTYYNEALNEYASINYDVLHGFIIDGLGKWYRQWQPVPDFDLEGAEEDAVQVTVPDAAGQASASVGYYSTTRKTAGPAGGASEATPPPIWILSTYDVVRHVRCRTSCTYDIVRATSSLRHRVEHRTYDVVRAIYRI